MTICRNELFKAGKAAPRTCPTCGLSRACAKGLNAYDALVSYGDAEKARRAAAMPTEADALKAMHDAYTRLKELGFKEAIYSPKDGTVFDAIEPGSTGVHKCVYHGEWPTGGWWWLETGDLWPARPCLYRDAK